MANQADLPPIFDQTPADPRLYALQQMLMAAGQPRQPDTQISPTIAELIARASEPPPPEQYPVPEVPSRKAQMFGAFLDALMGYDRARHPVTAGWAPSQYEPILPKIGALKYENQMATMANQRNRQAAGRQQRVTQATLSLQELRDQEKADLARQLQDQSLSSREQIAAMAEQNRQLRDMSAIEVKDRLIAEKYGWAQDPWTTPIEEVRAYNRQMAAQDRQQKAAQTQARTQKAQMPDTARGQTVDQMVRGAQSLLNIKISRADRELKLLQSSLEQARLLQTGVPEAEARVNEKLNEIQRLETEREKAGNEAAKGLGTKAYYRLMTPEAWKNLSPADQQDFVAIYGMKPQGVK